MLFTSIIAFSTCSLEVNLFSRQATATGGHVGWHLYEISVSNQWMVNKINRRHLIRTLLLTESTWSLRPLSPHICQLLMGKATLMLKSDLDYYMSPVKVCCHWLNYNRYRCACQHLSGAMMDLTADEGPASVSDRWTSVRWTSVWTLSCDLPDCWVVSLPQTVHRTPSVWSESTGSGGWSCWLHTIPVGTGSEGSRDAAGSGPRARIFDLYRTRPLQRVFRSLGRSAAVWLAVRAAQLVRREARFYVELAGTTRVLQAAPLTAGTWAGGRTKCPGHHGLSRTMSRAEPDLLGYHETTSTEATRTPTWCEIKSNQAALVSLHLFSTSLRHLLLIGRSSQFKMMYLLTR